MENCACGSEEEDLFVCFPTAGNHGLKPRTALAGCGVENLAVLLKQTVLFRHIRQDDSRFEERPAAGVGGATESLCVLYVLCGGFSLPSNVKIPTQANPGLGWGTLRFLLCVLCN